ncbi:hypothetical protein CF319_g4599 [Tilletia indica]|nr:hypothetical protein CF319_g4599 [Tilletia indica]
MLFKETATRNDTSSKYAADVVARTLAAMQEDVKESLVSVQNRFEDEVDVIRTRLQNEVALAHAAMKSRLEKELSCANAAINRKMSWTVLAVEGTLNEAGQHSREGLFQALEILNACGAILQRDINSTELNYMRSLSHIWVGSTFHSAM